MRVGFVGLGKLGLPVALAVERAGHEVLAVESSAQRVKAIRKREVPESHHEHDLGVLLEQTDLQLVTMKKLVDEELDIVFVCVQTPHQPEFEGNAPLHEPPQDFDYEALEGALKELDALNCISLIAVVSTCLPGTIDRLTKGLALRIAYNPLFIAMGTVIKDYEHPEFVLVGSRGSYAPAQLREFYDTITHAPIHCMSVVSAELTKVAYNAAIGFKLLLANTVAEIADRMGGDCDHVMDALKRATDRLISPAYLTPGMGDGGGCHPRDQIALSWLAGRIDLSSNPFQHIIEAREAHARWLTRCWTDASDHGWLKLAMLGSAYKPNTNIQTGSAAHLVASIAERSGRGVEIYDTPPPELERAFFIGTPHDWVLQYTPRRGSVVVDPWGRFPPHPGVELVRPGRRTDLHQHPGQSF